MPIIGPPKDDYPPDPEPQLAPDSFRDRWIKFYLDCPNWICPVCATTNFGRNKFCPYCRFKLKQETLRPDSYRENTYAEVYHRPKNDSTFGE